MKSEKENTTVNDLTYPIEILKKEAYLLNKSDSINSSDVKERIYHLHTIRQVSLAIQILQSEHIKNRH